MSSCFLGISPLESAALAKESLVSTLRLPVRFCARQSTALPDRLPNFRSLFVMNATQVLQDLKRILWGSTETYSTQPAMKAAAEDAVKKHYESKGLKHRGATVAEIRGGFHESDKDPQKHVTVDFKKGDGSHVTTHHVKE